MRISLLSAMFAVAALAGQSFGGENYALLVAVGDYDPKQLNRLPYTRNDILEFHELLLQSGFDESNITLMHDDTKQAIAPRLLPEASKIRRQLTLLLSGRDEDDTIILAFAGHGVQFKGGDSSFFCPLDVDLEKKETLLPFHEIYEAMKACPARKKLLLVDACRNDPRTTIARSRSTVDLESITRPQIQAVPESVIAFFSCAAGQQSFEWPDLKHGVFFYHLLDVWKNGVDGQQELTLDDMVYQTRKRTDAFARKTLDAVQTPEIQGKSSGRWVLREYPRFPLFDATRPRTPEEVSAAQGMVAEKLKTTIEAQNTLGMKFRLIPPGEYFRGATAQDIDALVKIEPGFKPSWGGSLLPRHRVRLTKPFYLGAHEVTQGEWKSLMGTEPWAGKEYVDTGKDHPASHVSWHDAQAFCRKLSERERRSYRLPTEAEWEFAARAGTQTLFGGGNDVKGLSSRARVTRLEPDLAVFDAKGFHYTIPVGKLRPNAFGLFDIQGNVSEWCQDYFGVQEYQNFETRTAVNPGGPDSGESRVRRGGGWADWFPSYLFADRAQDAPEKRDSSFGFRVLIEIPENN